jgi:hypothetical protein
MLSCRAVLHCIPVKFVSHLAATTTSDGGCMERDGLRIITSRLQAKLLNQRFHELSVVLQISMHMRKMNSALFYIF